jgi:putative endonuclease
MDFYVYVLKNKVTSKLYKGQTHNLQRRLAEHSWSHTKSTRNYSKEWQLIYHEIVGSREQAIVREKYFKTAAGRRFLKPIIEQGSSTDTRPNVPLGTGGE